MAWLRDLDTVELQELVLQGAPNPKSLFLTVDDLGADISARASSSSELDFGFSDELWEKVKHEFKLLVCVPGGKYADLQERAEALSGKGTTALIAVLAGALGSIIGISAAALSPLIALLVLATIRIGKESFCALSDLNVKVAG